MGEDSPLSARYRPFAAPRHPASMLMLLRAGFQVALTEALLFALAWDEEEQGQATGMSRVFVSACALVWLA